MDIVNMDRKTKQPDGIGAIFCAQIAIMAGTAIFNGLLVFYAIQSLRISSNAAYLLYAAYGTLEYITPILGGYIGAKLLGYREASVWGAILCAFGLFFMGVTHQMCLTSGLALFAFGSGLLVPNLFSLFGELYSPEDKRRDSGFTIVYAAMNIGALTGYMLSGFFAIHANFHFAFYVAGINTFIAAIIIHIGFRKKQLGHFHPHKKKMALLYCIIGSAISIWVVHYTQLLNDATFIIGILVFIVILGFAITRKNRQERMAVLAFCYLGAISILFWALYLLTPTLLNVFNENFVNRHVFSLSIPASNLLGLNPLILIATSFLAAKLWTYLAKKNVNFGREKKFALSSLMLAIAFFGLAVGCSMTSSKLSLGWIVLFFVFQSTAEILISPTGYSFVGVLFERYDYTGVMLGVWQSLKAISAAAAGYIAVHLMTFKPAFSAAEKLAVYKHGFLWIAYVAIALFIISLVCNKLFMGKFHRILNR